MLDTQQIELIGRAWLESELTLRGFEVARPNRDKGIDLIAFRDTAGLPFTATPIQLKAASERSFGIEKKYQGRGIVMAYVWGIGSSNRCLYLVPYEAAVLLLTDDNRQTVSWKEKGGYSTSSPSRRLISQIEKYRNNFECLCTAF